MNMKPRLLQLSQQSLQFRISASVNIDPISLKRKSLVRILEQLYQPCIFLRRFTAVLRQILCHRFFEQTVITFLTDNLLTPLATPKKEIENQPYNRKKHQDQNPCHCLHRITIVENHDDNRTDNSPEINNIKGNGSYYRYDCHRDSRQS